MNVYLDTSVILSHLLNQANRLRHWGEWDSIQRTPPIPATSSGPSWRRWNRKSATWTEHNNDLITEFRWTGSITSIQA